MTCRNSCTHLQHGQRTHPIPSYYKLNLFPLTELKSTLSTAKSGHNRGPSQARKSPCMPTRHCSSRQLAISYASAKCARSLAKCWQIHHHRILEPKLQNQIWNSKPRCRQVTQTSRTYYWSVCSSQTKMAVDGGQRLSKLNPRHENRTWQTQRRFRKGHKQSECMQPLGKFISASTTKSAKL